MKNAEQKEQPVIIILSDNAKVIDGILIPDKKQLRRWIAKNHPEYLEECEANDEFT